MKDEKDNHLDKVFQKGLRDPVEPNYREQDWNSLEQMLGKSKNSRGAMFWLPVLSSAAVILIVSGLWLLRPRPIQNRLQKQQPQLAAQHVKKTDATGKAIAHHEPSSANVPGNVPATVRLAASGSQAGAITLSQPGTVIKTKEVNAGNGHSSTGKAQEQATDFALTAVSLGINDNNWNALQPNALSDVSLTKLPEATPGSIAPKRKIEVKTGWGANPRYALNVLGAPELNGVNSLQQTRSGTNAGLLFSVGLFNKLTISTGAQYSNKPYNSYFNNYYVKSFNSDLTSINANCRVLDIPLNLDYQLFGSYRNKFSIGTGFSSYIMLHESYVYNYSNPTVVGPVNYTVPYSNKYLFDILNLQATYTRQVNAKVGLTFTPYVKLPLTGIGANQARLQTTGLALGLNWNLNSLYKP